MTSFATWTPSIMPAEVQAFSDRLDTTQERRDAIEASWYVRDVATRHGNDVQSYASHVRGDGFEVTIEVASGAHCSVTVTTPTAKTRRTSSTS